VPSAPNRASPDEGPLVPKAFSSVFPGKLYDLLVDSEINGLGHIISFQPHGRAFKVHRIFMFESIVLPECARKCNLHAKSDVTPWTMP
jgi:hypothetical protein